MGVGRLGIDSGTTSKCFVFWDCFRNFQKNKKLFRSIWHFGPDPDQVQNSWTLVPLSPSSLLSSTSIRWSLCIDYTQPSGVWLVTIIISVIIVIIRIIIRMMNHQQRKLDGRRGWGIDYTSRWLVTPSRVPLPQYLPNFWCKLPACLRADPIQHDVQHFILLVH